MTAEIAIMNRGAVALAADSALTAGKDKVWKTSNKLFSLSPAHDIGIMIYGSADFVGFPWETVIKLFRRQIKAEEVATVKACAVEFVKFISSPKFTNKKLETLNALVLALKVIEKIKRKLKYKTKKEFRRKVVAEAKKLTSEYEQAAQLHQPMPFGDFDKVFGDMIFDFCKETFKEVITGEIRNSVIKAVYAAFSHQEKSEYETGIVIAGFGSTEIVPCITHLVVDGRYGTFVRTWEQATFDLSDPAQPIARILPFAQIDMFYLFMEGVSHQYLSYVAHALGGILNKKSEEIVKDFVSKKDERTVELAKQKRENMTIVEEFNKAFDDYRNKHFVQPVMSVISSLPKEEMAAMAEALVELTSLRRKISSQVESVSGPVDVAVISKGDGFIWIKRKHYFNLDLNKDFLLRKAAQIGGHANVV